MKLFLKIHKGKSVLVHTYVKKMAVKFLSTQGVVLVPKYTTSSVPAVAERIFRVIKISLQTSSNKVDGAGDCSGHFAHKRGGC